MSLSSTPHVMQAARLIRVGGVVAYPTEACFGIGCDPVCRPAMKRILQLKSRPPGIGMILIAHCMEAILPYIDVRHESILEEPLQSWPGPHTWIFPASQAAVNLLCSSRGTVAARVTAHPIAAQLCRLAGRAIVSTSANVHGKLPAREYGPVCRSMGGSLDFVVRGPIGSQTKPTQIRDALSGRIVRAA